MRFDEIAPRAEAARAQGIEVVAVLGLGFVGTAVAANLSRTLGAGGRARFFVVGLDLDTPAGRAKTAALDAGRPPAYASDPSLVRVMSKAALETKNLCGTVDPRALALADVVVACINLDLERAPGQTERLGCRTELYAEAMRTVGRQLRPGALVAVESTLPVGTCDRVLYPALLEGWREQSPRAGARAPLLAYCYERVMPGPDYLDSVNNFWRAYAGIDAESADRAAEFLGKYVDTQRFPLWRHKHTRAAEMAKLLENSYRAVNIAFIEEWAELAEGAGVDLFDVIASIRLRRGTHDNMMLPGLGVGGYCLTKDAMLAAYGAERLLGLEAPLPFSRLAILTNERMPLRAVEWIEEHFGGELRGRRAAIFGVTYRPGVSDTRSSPAETVARALLARGMEVRACDPLIERWDELPELPCEPDAERALEGADAVVVCLPDRELRASLPPLLCTRLAPGAIVVDPWNVVAAGAAAELARAGVALRVYGRGDVPLPSAAATPASA